MKKLLATTLICSSLAAPVPAIASSDGERLAGAILLAILAEIMSNTNNIDSHSILIEADAGVDYRIEVNGSLSGVDSIGLERNDRINGGVAEGRVQNDADAYIVSGQILRIAVSNPERVTVTIDGRRLTAQELAPLIAAQPDPQPQPHPQPNHGFDFTGTWQTQHGPLNLVQFIVGNDRYVVGDYGQDNIVVGRVFGNCVSGTFTNETNARANGHFRMYLKNGTLDGQWRWSDWSSGGDWDGTRTGSQAHAMHNWSDQGIHNVHVGTGANSQSGTWAMKNMDHGQMHSFVANNIWLADINGGGIMAALSNDGVHYHGWMTGEGNNSAVSFSLGDGVNGTQARGEWTLPSGRELPFDMEQTSKFTTAPVLGSNVIRCN